MRQTLFTQVARLSIVAAIACLMGLNSSSIQCQAPKQTALSKPATATMTRPDQKLRGPKFTAYRGVHIGMSADEARQKLGRAKVKDKTQDLYVFSDNESAQVFYDDKQQVYAISVDHTGKDSSAPAPVDILGQDVTPKANGSIYQMQQYTDAGYWVSYNRTAGESPVVTVTMQRIQ
jgi:hypothetical protein